MSYERSAAAAAREKPARLFFGIWPDAAARDAVAVLARDVAAAERGKSPPSSNLHMTLAFVGEVAPDRVYTLAQIGIAAAETVAPFHMTLDCVGGFRDAGIAWLGTTMTPAPLRELVRALRAGLGAEGFRVERREFAAHVTLARKCRTPTRARRVEPVTWPVDSLTLVASQLAPGGSRYATLVTWPLSTGTEATPDPSQSDA